MLRRNLLALKVSRNWTKKSLTTKAHFPLKVVDPAEMRDGAATAKEQKVFFVTKDGDPNKKKHGIAATAMNGVRNWAQVVRLYEPTGVYLMLIPSLWGTAMACTRALIFEGADPVVLCAPLLPLHLVVLLSLGTFTFRAAGCIANDLINKDRLRAEMTEAEKEANPIINGKMQASQAGGILAAHATIGAVVALNLSPAAITALCSALPLAVLYPILQRVVKADAAVNTAGGSDSTNPLVANANAILAQALFTGLLCNMGIFVGYGAVVNRIDWWVCGPAYIAAVSWTMLYQVIYSFQRRHDVRTDIQITTNATPLSTNTNHANNPFGSQKKKDSTLKGGASKDGSKKDNTPITDKFFDSKLLLTLLQIPTALGVAMAGALSPQAIFFYGGLAWSTYYLASVVDHVNIHDRWSCHTAYRRNVKYAWMVLLAIMAGNAFWAFASEYEPHKDKQSISEQSALRSAISFGNQINPRSYDATQFTWMDRFLKPAFVQGQALAAQGVPPDQIVIPPWMRREHFGENCSKIVRYLLGGYVSDATITSWESWWYGVVDHYNLLAKWAI